MLYYTFYYNAFLMGSLTIFFHHVLRKFNVETQLFEKFSVNMMRSVICGTIAHEAYIKYKYIWLDKCLENNLISHKFEVYHNMFLSYFVFDTILLWYQVYLRIEKKIRLDLFFHHILAISALLIIEEKKMYSISLMIGLSEGMSLVTGPKLLSMHFGNKYLTNIFIIYRLLYLIFVRMLFIWPSLIYFYNYITLNCDKYKEDRNILMVLFLIGLIFHAEISWLHSGRNELVRI
jgi:hypothetical protein